MDLLSLPEGGIEHQLNLIQLFSQSAYSVVFTFKAKERQKDVQRERLRLAQKQIHLRSLARFLGYYATRELKLRINH